MATTTAISWTDSTFNPWSGCTKVSEGCKFCYAEREARRMPAVKGVWGPNGTRVARVPSYWRKAYEWDREAAASGKKHLVFCASIADVFEQWDGPIVDHKGLKGWVSLQDGSRLFSPLPDEAFVPSLIWRPLTMDDLRLDLLKTIMETPHLTWLMVTKRIEHVVSTLSRCCSLNVHSEVATSLCLWCNGYPPVNVWMLTSVEDQATAEARIPHLLKIPALVRGVSYEPAIGPVDFRDWLRIPWMPRHIVKPGSVPVEYMEVRGLDWIIMGGESGAIEDVRPFDVAWARKTRDQCKAAGTAFFLKQLGRDVIDSGGGDGTFADLWPEGTNHLHFRGDDTYRVWLHDKKGGDQAEWPEDLRGCQEFPR